MRELSRLTGINKMVLSFIERGRMIPTGEEFIAASDALERVRRSKEVAGA